MSNIILPQPQNIIVPAMRVGGEFMFTKLRRTRSGKRKLVWQSDWQHNLITNLGMDRIGAGAALGQYLRIGTGTVAPAFTDTGLAAYSATSAAASLVSAVNAGAPNYETVFTHRYDYAAGVLNGTYTELGLSWTNNNSANTLFSRALILDAGGNPTSITVVGPDEILQVTYRMTWYPNLADATGSINITGSGTHAFTARGINVQAALPGYLNTGPYASVGTCGGYTGGLVALTATGLTGTTSAFSGTLNAYSAGSYSRSLNLQASISQGNLAGGITSILVALNTSSSAVSHRTQIQFTPPIPKTSSQTLTLPCTFSWARH